MLIVQAFMIVSEASGQVLATYPLRNKNAAVGNTEPGDAWVANTDPNINAGARSLGANMENPSQNSTGWRARGNKQDPSKLWPSTATEGYHFQFPLSTKPGYDAQITGITVDITEAMQAPVDLMILPAFQVNGSGPWVPMCDPVNVTAAANSFTQTLNFPVNETLYDGRSYVIRFYIYGGPTSDDDDEALRLINLQFLGTMVSPPSVQPSISIASAVKSSTAPKYEGVVTGTYDFGATYHAVKESGVVWSTSPNPTVGLTTKNTDGASGIISSTITGLTANTQYYVRTYAITQSDILYSNELSFTTDPPTIPVVTTNPITDIRSNKATASFSIPDSGGVAISERGIVWSTSPNPTADNNMGKIFAGNGTSSFSDLIKGLSPETKYYVRSYAVNAIGTGYSDEVEFTTAAPAPVLSAIPGSIDFGENFYGESALTISYNLTGQNLSPASGNVVIVAPQGFFVSLKGNTDFAQTITLPYSGGRIQNRVIYVQLPSTNYGSFSGDIVHMGGGVDPQDADIVKVSGSIIQSEDELSNRGNDFWLGFAFQEKMKQKSGVSAEAQLSVYISTTDQPAEVVVEIPGQPGAVGFPKTLSLQPNSVVEVTGFPTGDTNNYYNTGGFPDTRLYATGVQDKGIHVYTTNGTPVSVWMHTYADNNSAAGAMVFPTNTWSSEYVVQSYGGTTNAGTPNSYFFVIAAEDNTEIEFTPTNDILNADQASLFTEGHTAANVLYAKGGTYRVTLNKGQVFNAMGIIQGNNGLDLTGTKVKTTCGKKIAVFAGNGRVLVNRLGCSSGSGSDHLVQQMFPTSAWGTKYLTAPTKTMEHNLFRVVVKDPTTVVKRNGATLTGLVNNLYYQFDSKVPELIESDKPINVIQYIVVGSCGDSGGEGDPEMIILSPVQQAIKNVTVYSAGIKRSGANNNNSAHYINVIIEKEAIENQSFKLDNIDFNSNTQVNIGSATGYGSQMVLMKNAFKVHPKDPNYYYANFRVADKQAHTISSDYDFVAIAYGMGNGESYGYNAGTAVKNLSSVKIAINPEGVDTSSTAVRTAKNNPVTLRIALPHNPHLVDRIVWDSGTDPRITPMGNNEGEIDAVTGKAKYEGTIDIEGRTFYIYSSPVQYKFSEEGISRMTATAYGTFESECGGEDRQRIAVIVGRDNIDFSFSASCGNPNVHFINNTTPMPGSTITKWHWDFGDGTTFDSQTPPPHTYNTDGGVYQYMVKLTTTNSVGTITTDSLEVDFSGGIETHFAIDDASVCSGETVTFDPSLSQVTGTTSGDPIKWTWNFGDGTQEVINGASSPVQTHVYTQPGKYIVRLLQETDSGCGHTYIDSVTVGASPESKMSAPLEACINTEVQYTDLSTVSVGTIGEWLWTFDDGTTSTEKNPKHIWTTHGDHTVTLTVKSVEGCDAINTATHTIKVLPLPVADFVAKMPLCVNEPTVFEDASSSQLQGVALSEWGWDFGDGSPYRYKNVGDSVQHIYTQPGNYTVRLWVTNSGGCVSDTTSKIITISPQPKPDFAVNDICITDGQLQFNAVNNEPAAPVTSWKWNFGDGSPEVTTAAAQHTYQTGGIYDITLIGTTATECETAITKQIKVTDKPTPAFSIANEAALCSDSPVLLTNASVVNGYGDISRIEIYWDYANAPNTKETYDAPFTNNVYQHKYPNPTTTPTASYKIVLRAYTNATCYDEISKDIVINAMPVAQLSALPAICQDVLPFPLTQGRDARNLPGNGVYSGRGVTPAQEFSPQLAGPGVHNITYTYTTTTGCVNSVTAPIEVYPSPVIDYKETVYVKEGERIMLSPRITAGGTQPVFKWSPALHLDDPTTRTPICTIPKDLDNITYLLEVEDENGCKDNMAITVVQLRELVPPNTFTPNGDGVNDIWEVEYIDAYPGLTLEIFNRYGKRVFNATRDKKSWDGKYKGEDLPVGTYYYIIDPKNGDKLISGSVTIIR